MFENLDHNSEKSELFERAKSLKAQFKDRYEAIEFFEKKLEKICSARRNAVEDLVLLAESQAEYEPELMEVLLLERRIKSLKSLG